jgi:UDPglucose 6-dehydrogenase
MIGYIGLSHLGLVSGVAAAAKGFEVICFDPDSELVGRLSRSDFPIEEPGFKEMAEQHRKRLHYTSDPAELLRCKVVFYALDVRTTPDNRSDLGPLTTLIEDTARFLRPGATAVVMSQVHPGYMRRLIDTTGPSAVSWFYQVETLVFGNAVKRSLEPERFIVGSPTPGQALPAAYEAWLGAFDCPVLVMRLESAELAKIAINLFLVSSVTTTNMLAELCEAVGADWTEIAPALRLDRRIGPHAYLKPGLGIAGGNLERDVVTAEGLALEHGTEAGILGAWQRNSARARFWAFRVLERDLLKTQPAARVAIWGLAYKEDTHSIKNSASIELIRTLSGCDLHAYDPVAQVGPGLVPNLTLHRDATAALAEADVLAIMTPWREFADITPATIAARMKGKLVVDPFGILGRAACAAAGLRHLQIGVPGEGTP